MFTINKYVLWYNKHPLSVMFVTRREKKGNLSDVKEYVYTVKRGLTIEPEDLKLSRKYSTTSCQSNANHRSSTSI